MTIRSVFSLLISLFLTVSIAFSSADSAGTRRASRARRTFRPMRFPFLSMAAVS